MKLTRVLSLVLAAVLLVSCLLMGGCSTPEYALEVDGKKFTMGDYLAYVYAVMSGDYAVNYYLSYYGKEAFDQEVSYTEDERMDLDEYILTTAQDTMIRQVVLEKMMQEHGIAKNADDLKELENELKNLTPDMFIDMGFNNQRYIDMIKAVNLNESSLFLGLYDKGGKRAVADTDIRKYFDDNHVSYKYVEISLVNSDKSEKSADEIAKIRARLQRYLDAFNAGEKTGEAFDKAIYTAYQKDEAASKTTTAVANGKTTVATTTTTTAATTTTTAATTTTTSSSTGNGSSTGSTTQKEEIKEATRYDTYKDDFTDEELYKVITAIPEGTAEIKTYKKNGTTNTMALIFRMDSEAERDTTNDKGEVTKVDYFAGQRETILQKLKYEEFDKEVKEGVKALEDTIVRHKRALNAPDLWEMAQLAFGLE